MGFDWASLDGFILTKPLATNALRRKVDALLGDLDVMQSEYSGLINDYTTVAAKLDKMEEKAEFVVSELEKTLAIFEPPPPGQPETDEELLQREVHGPLATAELTLFGASVFLGIVGYVKMRPYAKGLSAAVKAGVKTGGKLGGKAARYAFLAKNAKAARAARIGRFAGKLGTIGLVVGAVAYGLSIKESKKMNAYYKEKNGEIREQIADVSKTMQELRDAISEAKEMIADMLAGVGVETIEQYTDHLNQALATLGKEAANLGTARRMLIDGMPPDIVLKYVPGVKQQVVADIVKRLEAERAMLDGASNEAVVETSGLKPITVVAIREILAVRSAIVRGEDLDDLKEKNDYSDNLIEGERERLEEDLRPVWAKLTSLEKAQDLVATLLVSLSDIEHLIRELRGKEQLHGGTTIAAVAAQLGVAEDEVESWSQELEVDMQDAAGILKAGSLVTPESVAISQRLPFSILPAKAA